MLVFIVRVLSYYTVRAVLKYDLGYLSKDVMTGWGS